MLKTDETRRREHEAVRNNVAFHDFSHELVEVIGKDAGEFLDRIFVNSMADLKTGGSNYTTMLNEDGEIIDDLIVFRLGERRYWLSTLEAEDMLNWLEKNHKDEQVEYRDIQNDIGMIAVQGPNSHELLSRIADHSIDDLESFDIGVNSIKGWTVWIARAGFTGEDYGYELYPEAEYLEDLLELLHEEGKDLDVVEIETDVFLKSLPVEQGLVLMSDVGGLKPYEAKFAWTVDWDTDFVGKEALQEEKDNNPSPVRLWGYEVQSSDDDVDIEEGSPVYYNDEEIGTATSFTYGYTVDNYIGFAQVDTDKVSDGDTIIIKATNGNKYEAKLKKDRTFV